MFYYIASNIQNAQYSFLKFVYYWHCILLAILLLLNHQITQSTYERKVNKMTERRLKDYKGNEVWKCTDDNGETFYMYNTPDGDNINVYKSLQELKKDN